MIFIATAKIKLLMQWPVLLDQRQRATCLEIPSNYRLKMKILKKSMFKVHKMSSMLQQIENLMEWQLLIVLTSAHKNFLLHIYFSRASSEMRDITVISSKEFIKYWKVNSSLFSSNFPRLFADVLRKKTRQLDDSNKMNVIFYSQVFCSATLSCWIKRFTFLPLLSLWLEH